MSRTSPLVNQSVQRHSSPLETKVANRPSVFENSLKSSPVLAPAAFQMQPPAPFNITKEEIEKLGANAAEPMKAITSQILASVSGGNNDPMTQSVNNVVKTLKGLSFEGKEKPGLIKRLFGKAQNLLEDMKSELQTAEQRLQEMGSEVNKGIKLAEKRKKELEQMGDQNKQYGLNLDRDYQVGENYLNQLKAKMQAELDSSANVEAKETQGLVDICEQELAEIKAYRLIAANNVPKIEGMIKTVENLIRAGDNVINKMMPVYMINFAQYVISLESKNSASTLQNVHDSFNAGLVEGSNLALENLTETAKLQGQQSVTIESMRIMHENMLQGFEELDKIAEEQRVNRRSYVSELTQMEGQLKNKLSLKDVN